MKTRPRVDDKKIDRAILVFKTKMTYQELTDQQLGVVIETLQEMIVERRIDADRKL